MCGELEGEEGGGERTPPLRSPFSRPARISRASSEWPTSWWALAIEWRDEGWSWKANIEGFGSIHATYVEEDFLPAAEGRLAN